MLRTLAVLLVLLGLTVVTPVVCLCAPTALVTVAPRVGDGERAQDVSILPNRAAFAAPMVDGNAGASETPSLVAAIAAAAAALSIATIGGLPPDQPWQLPRLAVSRLLPVFSTLPLGPSRSPAVLPPR